MTRFEQEIKGLLGDFWKKEAEKELDKRRAEIANNEVIFENGVARWRSNNGVVPSDIALQFSMVTDLIDMKKCESARDVEIENFFRNMKPTKLSDEEKFEMDAAFGSNKKVVNVLTGEVYTTK